MNQYIILSILLAAFTKHTAFTMEQLVIPEQAIKRMSSKNTTTYFRPAEYFEEYANRGNDYAQYNLGVIYENGIGVNVNKRKAFNLYRKSAEHGNTYALYNLGQMYTKERGIGLSIFYEVESYALAAKNGHKKARQKLKELSAKYGEGIVEYFMGDYKSAFSTCSQEAKNGNYVSQLCLERMYESEALTNSTTSDDDD